MAVYINVPDSANAVQKVALGGLTYTFDFSYNSRDKRYRLSIALGDTPVITGMKLIESVSPTNKYNLVDFDHGQLTLIRVEDTGQEAGRGNVGLDKPYRLAYLTNKEISEL